MKLSSLVLFLFPLAAVLTASASADETLAGSNPPAPHEASPLVEGGAPTEGALTGPSTLAAPAASPRPATPAEAPKRDYRTPRFYDVKPQWGIELGFSPNALGKTALTTQQGSTPAFAFSLASEFQPMFLQFFGIIGVGLTANLYPILGGQNLTPNLVSIWSAGGQIRYQAKYFRQQIVVPNIAYSYEYFNYAFSAGQKGNLWAQGPIYGLWVLLNQLDRSATADFYIDAGVARSYLILEARNLAGNDGTVSFSGVSYYAGLRFEF